MKIFENGLSMVKIASNQKVLLTKVTQGPENMLRVTKCQCKDLCRGQQMNFSKNDINCYVQQPVPVKVKLATLAPTGWPVVASGNY